MSNSSDLNLLHRIILKHCYNEELDPNDLIENCSVFSDLNRDVIFLLIALNRGQRINSLPSDQHENLHKALTKIRQAQHVISNLPRNIIPSIRLEYDRRNGTNLETEIAKAYEERGTLTIDEFHAIQKRCATGPELWIDNATQAALSDLYLAIETQIETLPPPRKGRKGNVQAQELTRRALIIYERASGLSAGYWNGGETPFTRFVRDLFLYFKIECDLRRPIERAILCRNSEK